MYKFSLYRILSNGDVKTDPLWQSLSIDDAKKIIFEWLKLGNSFHVEVDI